jgi:hypothetical protein
MATTITQEPLYDILPVGQDIMFAVANNGIVANQVRVKFIAEVHISNTSIPNLNTSTYLIGTFKTTPNNAGIGMFNLSSVVESHVKAENLATTGSQYKGLSTTSTTQHPLHLIDKFTGNDNTMRYLGVRFKVEYLDADSTSSTYNQIITASSTANSDIFKIFNGYLKHSDQLEWSTTGFGYDASRFEVDYYTTGEFLTNAPLTQYANVDDYGTMAYLTKVGLTQGMNGFLNKIQFRFYDFSGSIIGSPLEVDRTSANGAYSNYNGDNKFNLIYFGCYPANIKNWNSTIKALFDAGSISYYEVRGYLLTTPVTKIYTININCPTLKGYVPIRLAWLNQWGAWDYYTFTQKSIRSLSTKGSTYTQQSGTWNDSMYRVQGFKGGEKSFRVNATERIRMNTDFVNEAESEWFEELINSPEVYILEGYQTDLSQPVLNNYVTPVKLTTSSYIRKTRANDKLMQYTFEVEKSKILRTQAV